MLEVNNIDVYYGDLQALWDISFTLQKGEIIAFLGPNGAGKSTLLDTVAGLLKPVKGTMNFNGICLNRLPPHEIVKLGISLVPEGKRLFPMMSVLENLEMGAFIPENRKVKDDNLRLIYRLFPILAQRKEQKAGTLSGGEQQMLAIGRSLMSSPKLLLLDEPSLGLAPLVTKNIFNVIKDVGKTGVTIVLVEQNVHMSLEIADSAYILENGSIVGHGEAKTLLEDQHVKEAYLGTA